MVVTVAIVPLKEIAPVPAGIAAPVKNVPENTYVFVESYKDAAGVFVTVYVKFVPAETVSTTHHPPAFASSKVP